MSIIFLVIAWIGSVLWIKIASELACNAGLYNVSNTGPTIFDPCNPKNHKSCDTNVKTIIVTGDCPKLVNGLCIVWFINSLTGVPTPTKNIAAIIPNTVNTTAAGIIAENALETAGGTCGGILKVHPFCTTHLNISVDKNATIIPVNIASELKYVQESVPHGAPSTACGVKIR